MSSNNSTNIDSVMSLKKGRILYITLNRPNRGNSLDPITLVKLRELFINAQNNSKINVIVLTGTGQKDFCTGIDIDTARDFSPAGKTNLANVAGDVASLIYHGKPTVVGINGRMMGMGVVFSCAADYRVAVDTTRMQMPEVNFGAFPGASCIAIMTQVCGVAWTRRILMSGDSFSIKEMLDAHITDEIISEDAFSSRITEVGKNLSRKHPVLLQMIKKNIVNMPYLSYSKGIELESASAEYYTWGSPQEKMTKLDSQYNLSFNLTGDPEQLLKDSETS